MSIKSQILINGLLLHGYHGMLQQENAVGNEFMFDLAIQTDFSRAAIEDNLTGTINYAEVIELIKEVNSTPSLLLENLAYRIDRALRKRFPTIESMTITVSKLAPPIAASSLKSVSVVINT
ncbi:MAG: dihydroneopterin aldolase [Muribaculaceae bacterium]|nr:dihydroneopterin aldolase [Muribaculaceae bacterium]